MSQIEFAGPLLLPEAAAPSTPAAGKGLVYLKSDGRIYSKGDDGVEILLSGVAGLSPVIVRKSDANLTLAVNAAYQDVDPSGTASSRDLDIVIPNVAVGQWVDFVMNILVTSSTVACAFDVFTVVSGAVVHKFGSPTSLSGPTPSAWFAEANKSLAAQGSVAYQIQTGDVENGSVRLRVRSLQASGAARVIFSAGGGLFLAEGRGPF